MYSEAEGGQGGNEAASVIMKYLLDIGYLESTTQFELSMIMDNYLDQNKDNCTICLPVYLTMNRYFETVHILFLIADHTKNKPD